jgi:hypothetical protein
MLRTLFLMLLLPFSAFAQSPVPSDVYSVASGGYWEAAGESGTYRVLVVNSGFEHVTSRVFVEWVRGPKPGESTPTVVASVEPELPFGRGIASLNATLQPQLKGKVHIVVSGVISAQPDKKVRAVLVATHPSLVTAVKANLSLNRDGKEPRRPLAQRWASRDR